MASYATGSSIAPKVEKHTTPQAMAYNPIGNDIRPCAL